MHRLKPIASTAAAAAAAALFKRNFRSEAALDAFQSHLRSSTAEAADNNRNNTTVVLYNYPSFSGAYAALFAHRYHSLLGLPTLVLPFSSVEPLRVEDFRAGGLHTCYLLDFIGPKNFAVQLSKIVPRVIAFDHRQSTVSRISQMGLIPENLELQIDAKKSSARAVHEYFSEELVKVKALSEGPIELLKIEEFARVQNVLRYIEDADLRRFELPDAEAFRIGVSEEMAKLNCITNPYVFEQLVGIDCGDLIAKGKSYLNSRQGAANELLKKVFKIRLGRGTYGECLATRADGNSNLSNEMCLELSRRSAAAGLSPIGAVVFMQRNNNLKMCLRSTDSATDTSKIAKAYGGGGKPSSSSFIIRMDEYNHWTAAS